MRSTCKVMGRIIATLVFFVLLAGGVAFATDEAQVYVILWFDTEDYLLPADDDATLRISTFLSGEGIRCTHKLVGEKARVLEQRGRRDVIDAIQKHEVGYHTDFHSVQPSPALFLSRQGWDDGVAEFDRRERRGLLDVQRITGQKPTCYGQPGSSWGPQQFGAMRMWGVPVYLDAGSHVQLKGDPFWYCGILNLYALKATLRTGLGGASELEEAKKRFDRAYQQLIGEGGGPVSIYYHPCEFVHKQFWDGVNFARGANPPRSEWRVPPQKSPQESETAYETFENYIRFIKAHPQVRFITASEALLLYSDLVPTHAFTKEEVRAIGQGVKDSISYQQVGGMAISAAEQFYLLNEYLRRSFAMQDGEPLQLQQSPFGPTQAAPEHETVITSLSQFSRTVEDVAGYLERHGRVPNAVWMGSTPISPESYLGAIARVASSKLSGEPLPDRIECRPAELGVAEHVSPDDPKLWGWVIFPPGFQAPDMMKLAKRQAWTLKPALLARSLPRK